MRKVCIAATVTLLAACSQQAPPTQPAPSAAEPAAAAATTPEQLQARISEYVFDPYDRANFPKLYKRLGKSDPTQRIQTLREGAALRALESGKCDFVEVAEISDSGGSNDDLVAFVDCRNQERFYIAEADLGGAATATANSERTLPRASAIEGCVAAARAAATFPALVDPHIWTGASYSTHKTMGAARVILNFDATNAAGVEIPYTANCLFPAGSAVPELTVTGRQ